jgi:hypothetical protein
MSSMPIGACDVDTTRADTPICPYTMMIVGFDAIVVYVVWGPTGVFAAINDSRRNSLKSLKRNQNAWKPSQVVRGGNFRSNKPAGR